MAWYIIQVRTGAEEKVCASLRRCGFVPYLPHLTKQVRHKRYKYRITKQFPLFPGYVFVWMLPEFDWRMVIRVRCVSGFLGLSDPTPISDESVNAIYHSNIDATTLPHPGDEFIVTYNGHRIPATVDRVTNDTIWAIATFMGKALTIERPLSEVA